MNQTLKQAPSQQQYTFTVGNITGDGVTLVDKDYNLIQLPKSLLPMGSGPGTIIHLTLRRDVELERQEEEKMNQLIEKLQMGEHVGDTIIGVEDDLGSSNEGEKNNENEKKSVEIREKTNSITKAQQVKSQVMTEEKPSTGMKKKPKIQQPKQQKPQLITKSSPEPQEKQKSSVRQKSASRRTSSAMKKIKSESTQTS